MSAMEQLREGLRGAAQRDVAARRARRLRRRAAAMLALVLIGSGAAAQATNVFETGPAAPDIRGQIPRYAPAPATDARSPRSCAFRGLRSRSASRSTRPRTATPAPCPASSTAARSAISYDGTFRPYAADRVGTCNVPQRPTIDSATVAGKAVVFGLAAPKTRTVVLRATGERFRVGPDRAFLFVVPTRGPAEVDMRE